MTEAETILSILDGGGWELHRNPAWDALTDEANKEQSWSVTRTEPPFSNRYGDRHWNGPTAFEAFKRAFKALDMPMPAPAQPEGVSMPQYWSVQVTADGEALVSIGNDWLSGERPLEKQDEQTIIGAAQHLLSFVGYGLPPSKFNPDDDEAAGAAAPVEGAASLPTGWSLTPADDRSIRLESPSGTAWRYNDAHSTGTSDDFIYSFLAALAAAPKEKPWA